jgi:hypothetical protein
MLIERHITRASSVVWVLCAVMMVSEAKQYLAYARECLKLAEEADEADIRQSLIELSRAWMEAALTEERRAASAGMPPRRIGSRDLED